MKRCPRCGSEEVMIHEYIGEPTVVCRVCGYDGRDELIDYPSERSSKREKSRHSPYRVGGARRSVKK